MEIDNSNIQLVFCLFKNVSTKLIRIRLPNKEIKINHKGVVGVDKYGKVGIIIR